MKILRKLASAGYRQLRSDTRGNVLMIFAFSLVPVVFATGMTIDYARAARTQTRLNAVTDAAALAGVTPQMLSKSRYESLVAVARNWYAQAGVSICQSGNVNQVIFQPCSETYTDDGATMTYSNGTLKVVIKDTTTSGLNRTITASYSADSNNMFGSILRSGTIPIGGYSTTNARSAPDIDFYVMLDTSGSMAFPVTSAGLSLLRSKTGGCAFACHSTNDAKARDANNNLVDYYGVATSFNIALRVDEAKKAIGNMMTVATNTSQNTRADYQAALYSFAAGDSRANNSFVRLQRLTSNLDLVGTAAGRAATSLYYNNGCPKQDFCNDDHDTASSDAFTQINAVMPDPGNGTANDKPQEVLFIVTDGMRDEFRPGGRPEIEFDAAQCNTIKSRGIRIAILYTEYLPSSMDGDSWSQTNVVPYLYKLEPALTACASPGLLYKVTTDDDISAALNKLFLATVTNAHITQ